jgi:hypothetical protein
MAEDTKWDYDITSVGPGDLAELVPVLDRRGNDGWELAASVPCDESATFLIFKRPKQVRRR